MKWLWSNKSIDVYIYSHTFAICKPVNAHMYSYMYIDICIYTPTHVRDREKKETVGEKKNQREKSRKTRWRVSHGHVSPCFEYMDIHLYTYMYVCIHTHICMHTYICIHIQVYTSAYIPKPYPPRWTLKKEPKRRETARERARPTSTSVGRPVPCFWRRQPRPPAAVPARCSCVRERRKCKEESFRAVAEEGSGVSHAAAGRTCAHAYTWMRACMCACKPIRAFTCAHPSICTLWSHTVTCHTRWRVKRGDVSHTVTCHTVTCHTVNQGEQGD